VRVIVVTREGEKKLGFEYLAAPSKPAKAEGDDGEDDDGDEEEAAAAQLEGPKPAGGRRPVKVPALEGAKGNTKALPAPGTRRGGKAKRDAGETPEDGDA